MLREVVHLVYASDTGYLDNVAVAIGSAFLWCSDRSRLVVDLLAIEIDDSDWDRWCGDMSNALPDDCRIVKHDIDVRRFDKLRCWHGSKGAYARLLLPELLDSVKWCIYADVDTLFTQDPLKLCDLVDENASIMGHLEYPFKSLEEQRVWFSQRGLPFDKEKYFCSGFVIMNLEWFRKTNASAKSIELLEKYPDAPLVDQEALNAVCIDAVKSLPFEWGCFGCEAFAHGRPCAIHFPGHNPWKFLENMFPDYIDAYNIWFKYAKYIFGKSWTCYSRRKNWLKYLTMRVLGVLGVFMREVFTVMNYWGIPFIGRYLKRHYASRKCWRMMVACMRSRKDWHR